MKNAIERIHEFDRFGMELGLDRVRKLLERLGDPHLGIPAIHVTGTNGKGSVCKYLEEGLSSNGYNVGLYSSPYIECFNERIRCAGRDISDDELDVYGNLAVDEALAMGEEGLVIPTEFEVVMAAAFLYFKAMEADILVLEAGMGGIGDATNVITDPLISVFTSVSFDHMAVLGNTLAQIAQDKAGIIKPGRPVVSNVTEKEAAVVIARKAYEAGSRLYDISGLEARPHDVSLSGQSVDICLNEKEYSDIEISMTGSHQVENIKTAVAVIEILRSAGEISVDRGKLYEGFRRAKLPGRFEVLSPPEHSFSYVLDGAHNEAGAGALADAARSLLKDKKILMVCGILSDKEASKMAEQFVRITSDFIVTQPDNPRRLDSDVLAEIIKKAGGSVIAETNDSADAVASALAVAEKYDVIMFAGSLFLIGEVRRKLRHVR